MGTLHATSDSRHPERYISSGEGGLRPPLSLAARSSWSLQSTFWNVCSRVIGKKLRIITISELCLAQSLSLLVVPVRWRAAAL